MSASAGRVLIIPKGTYDASATYHMLDLVVYDGSSYIAKQTTTGNLPTNTTYWQLLANGNAVAHLYDIGDVTITNPTTGQILKWNGSAWVNAEDIGGLKPHLVIISDHGSTVTVVKGGTTYTATETSSGTYETDVDEFGTYTIHALMNGDDAQLQLVVDTCKVYTVHDEHFHASITVTYPSGYTCMISGGSETYVATSSPYEFVVHSANTYVITTEDANQNTYTDTVIVTESGQSFSKRCPSGSQLPANDIGNWLFSGGRTENYTTLAEVLADSTCLAALIASQNAMDYLVRSTDWAGIGTVPTMTSNTTPSGECFGDSYHQSPPYNDEYYLAFNGEDDRGWWSSYDNRSNNPYVGYHFSSPTALYKARYKATSESGDRIYKFKYQGSNDGTNWTDISSEQSTSSGTINEIITTLTDNTPYAYVRCYVTQRSTETNVGIGELQFYKQNICDNQTAMSYIGLNNYASDTLLGNSTWLNAICNSTYFESVLNVKVPTMTSNTTPSGVCIGSTANSASEALWKAFDGDVSTYYCSQAGSGSGLNVGYEFTGSTNIYFCKFSVIPHGTTTFNIESSADGNTWTTLSTITGTGSSWTDLNGVAIGTNAYYRINRATNISDRLYMKNVQFYGRTDV